VSLLRKLRIGWAVLLSDGLVAFLGRLVSNIKALFRISPTVDECDIVYRVLRSKASRGLMIDVGAHHGAAFDKFASDGWRIVAFEPDENNRDKLNRAYRNYPNVSIDSRGVSDKAEKNVLFYNSKQSSGISGLLPFDQSHRPAGTIRTTTLEQVINEYNLKKIDFLKIDTEGLDLPVLNGLPPSVFPKVIICEFEDRKTSALDYSYVDLAGELEKRGYCIIVSEWHPIERYGQAHRWRCAGMWPDQIVDAHGWGNLIAVRSSSLAQQVLQMFPKER